MTFEKMWDKLNPEDQGPLVSTLGWLSLIEKNKLNSNHSPKPTPSERIAEYVRNGCVGMIDTSGFTREDFEEFSKAVPMKPQSSKASAT